MEKHDFHVKKSFGQNFLTDQHVLNKIIDAADISKDDLVIEVGPGIGALTQPLAERAGKVVALEIDKTLIPVLADTLSCFDNVEIVNEDVLKCDISGIIEKSGYKSVKLVANLPYYITTPIVMSLLENKYPIKSITVMVQKEVASRMSAKAGTKDYGALTLAVNYYSKPYLVANVPSNCFIPRPGVDSAVVRLSVFDEPPVQAVDVSLMFKLIKAAFSKRRKTLVNCIFGSEAAESFPQMSKEQIESLLVEAGYKPQVRGETLELKDFAKLANLFSNYKV